MNIELNYDQRARLELIAIHAGKSTGEMLVEAAKMLLDGDEERPSCSEKPQQFLSAEEMDARFARLLRH